MRKPLGSAYSFGCGGPLARTWVRIGAAVVALDVAGAEVAAGAVAVGADEVAAGAVGDVVAARELAGGGTVEPDELLAGVCVDKGNLPSVGP